MTSTDRAFIAALQKANATAPTLGGPHFAAPATPPAAKSIAAKAIATKQAAPLSQHLARRRTPALAPAAPTSAPAASGPFAAALEVETLSWPAVAQQLAHAGREGLVELLSTLAHRKPEAAPQVAIVGAKPGVGATTMLLALARVVGSVGGSTAILDLTADGAASQLGIRRGDQPRAASIDDLAIHSREDQLSVIALGSSATTTSVADACARLAASHELVLIDAGGPHSAASLRDSGVQTLLADTTPFDERAIAAAQAELAALDIAGVVETFAPFA